MAIYGSNFDYGQSPIYKDEGEEYNFLPIESTIESEGDIKIICTDGIVSQADCQMAVRDLLRDPGLETAVLISLFTDRRARKEDILPDNSGDKRGWFGDSLNVNGDADGSRLWLTFRGKITEATISEIIEHCKESLQWLIDDNVAESIDVSAVKQGLYTIAWTIGIKKPKTGNIETYKYYYNWQSMKYGRA